MKIINVEIDQIKNKKKENQGNIILTQKYSTNQTSMNIKLISNYVLKIFYWIRLLNRQLIYFNIRILNIIL